MKSLKYIAASALAVALVVTPAVAKKPMHHHKPMAKPIVCSLNSAPEKTGHIVADATQTMADFRGTIPADLLARAKGIIIVPSLVKVGFIIGGQGGDGVLLRRNGNTWSYPAFYSLGSPSLGLQAGISSAQVVMLLMSDRALAAVEREQFKLGSEAGIAILVVGGNGGDTSYKGDIIAWARASGAYIGLTINDSTLKQEPTLNANYYDRAVPFDDVFMGKACNGNADPLRASLH
jgi:lipid-binding SYLF domain-containing protein